MLDTYTIYKQLRRDGIGAVEAEAFVEVIADSYRNGFDLRRAVQHLTVGANGPNQARAIAEMIREGLPPSVGGRGLEGGAFDR